jgi:hypothetical protein
MFKRCHAGLTCAIDHKYTKIPPPPQACTAMGGEDLLGSRDILVFDRFLMPKGGNDMNHTTQHHLDLFDEYTKVLAENASLVRENAELRDQLQELRCSPCFDPETGNMISVEDFYQRY